MGPKLQFNPPSKSNKRFSHELRLTCASIRIFHVTVLIRLIIQIHGRLLVVKEDFLVIVIKHAQIGRLLR